jgi:hypothetical protein
VHSLFRFCSFFCSCVSCSLDSYILVQPSRSEAGQGRPGAQNRLDMIASLLTVPLRWVLETLAEIACSGRAPCATRLHYLFYDVCHHTVE